MPAVLQRFQEARGGGEEKVAAAQETQLAAILEAQDFPVLQDYARGL